VESSEKRCVGFGAVHYDLRRRRWCEWMTDCAPAADTKAEIGVFGGSGFYEFAGGVDHVKVDTPYGPPSDKVALAEVEGRKLAFLARHGADHSIPPHRIPYAANLWAMKHLGVERIISPGASGSLQPQIKRGEFVVCDQFVDRTKGRRDTFYDGPIVTHVSSADAYCPELRRLAAETAKDLGITIHEGGTAVVINGPRFSSRAESEWFTREGWHVVNMTQYPEVVLARELELCYCAISLVTDYDVGLVAQGLVEPVSIEEILLLVKQNNERVYELIKEVVKRTPKERRCPCANSLGSARIG
jgi:5'-methylthioadenosine phosphorylase